MSNTLKQIVKNIQFVKGWSIQQMAGIKKNLRTHIGRHTFWVLCAELGLSIETTAELMGITISVCKTYYKVTRQKVNREYKVFGKL